MWTTYSHGILLTEATAWRTLCTKIDINNGGLLSQFHYLDLRWTDNTERVERICDKW